MKQFRRSITNRRFLGILGAVGDYLKIDANILRIIFLILILLTKGALFVVYCLIAYLTPSEPISKLFEKQFFKGASYYQDNFSQNHYQAYDNVDDITTYQRSANRKDVTPKS